MIPTLIALLLFLAAYLVGAIPFGYLVGRAKGVDLFKEGSGNIGATNAGRVLGRKWGVIVFLFDFAKGAVPVAVVRPLARMLSPEAEDALGNTDVLRVGAAAFAFLGHLFPVYLRFRGGKGVATGAGTIAVLVPGPAFLAMLFWVVVLLASRTVSLASLAAVGTLVGARLLGIASPFAAEHIAITLYVLVGSAFVAFKHRSNVERLLKCNENPIALNEARRQTWLRIVHLLAVGFWFGGVAFFNFAAAPAIFESFKQVVNAGSSDRTANETIIPDNAETQRKDALANALAGSAVAPIFPMYFALQAICVLLALATALSWRNAIPNRGTHRTRVALLVVAFLTVAIGWPVSQHVSELRPLRFRPEPDVANAARQAFLVWHSVSLLLSFLTVLLGGVVLALASKFPIKSPDANEPAASS